MNDLIGEDQTGILVARDMLTLLLCGFVAWLRRGELICVHLGIIPVRKKLRIAAPYIGLAPANTLRVGT